MDAPMNRYTGTKTILATPMTRGEYVAYRAWELPHDENPDDAGYFVEYTDGGKPNMEGHSGYVSWSPKEQFENAYKPSGSYLDRLRIESAELEARLSKLQAALAGGPVLPASVIGDLSEQALAMELYARVLRRRLSHEA